MQPLASAQNSGGGDQDEHLVIKSDLDEGKASGETLLTARQDAGFLTNRGASLLEALMRLVWHQDFGLGVRGSEWDSTQVAVFGFVDDSRNIQSGRGFFWALGGGLWEKNRRLRSNA